MGLSEMLLSGLELMVLGMGMVFVFLAMLIVVMQGMSALAARLHTEPPRQPVQPAPIPVTGGGVTDPRLIAAISAAVRRYRASRSH